MLELPMTLNYSQCASDINKAIYGSPLKGIWNVIGGGTRCLLYVSCWKLHMGITWPHVSKQPYVLHWWWDTCHNPCHCLLDNTVSLVPVQSIIFLFPRVCHFCPCHFQPKTKKSCFLLHLVWNHCFVTRPFCSLSSIFFSWTVNCNCVLLSLLIRKCLHLTSCQGIFSLFLILYCACHCDLTVCHYICHIFTVDVQHSSVHCHRYKRTLYQICLWSLRSLTEE